MNSHEKLKRLLIDNDDYVDCEEFVAISKGIEHDWRQKLYDTGCSMTRSIYSWCAFGWMRYPRVSSILRDYTYHFDSILNTFLRLGHVPDDVFLRKMVYENDFEKLTEDNKRTLMEFFWNDDLDGFKDVYTQIIGSHFPKSENFRNLQKFTNDFIRDAIQTIDDYFERGAARLPQGMFVVRTVVGVEHLVNSPIQRGFLSTTIQMSVWGFQMKSMSVRDIRQVIEETYSRMHANVYSQSNGMQDQKYSRQDFDGKMTNNVKMDNNQGNVQCCRLIIYVPEGTPFVAMEPLSKSPGESEILLPRNTVLKLKRAIVCGSTLYWLVELSLSDLRN